MKSKAEEGLYNLYFHNCYNFNPEKGPVAVTMTVRHLLYPKHVANENYLKLHIIRLPERIAGHVISLVGSSEVLPREILKV